MSDGYYTRGGIIILRLGEGLPKKALPGAVRHSEVARGCVLFRANVFAGLVWFSPGCAFTGMSVWTLVCTAPAREQVC